MAMEAEEAVLRRPFGEAAGGDGEVSAAAAFLAAGTTDGAVDPAIWGDERRMKRELVAWAKAVASMAAAGNNASSSSPSTPSTTTHRRRGRV
ncbi:unnamed protein product [Urochloa humidicola]